MFWLLLLCCCCFVTKITLFCVIDFLKDDNENDCLVKGIRTTDFRVSSLHISGHLCIVLLAATAAIAVVECKKEDE